MSPPLCEPVLHFLQFSVPALEWVSQDCRLWLLYPRAECESLVHVYLHYMPFYVLGIVLDLDYLSESFKSGIVRFYY